MAATSAALIMLRLNNDKDQRSNTVFHMLFDMFKKKTKKVPDDKPQSYPYVHTCGKQYKMEEVLCDLERCEQCGGEFEGILTKKKREEEKVRQLKRYNVVETNSD